jgi:hypothetical protein
MTGKYVGSLLELQLIEFDEKLPKPIIYNHFKIFNIFLVIIV